MPPKHKDHKTISFIVPTIGRDSLQDTIASIELWDGDELLVIQHDPPSCNWGNNERQEGVNKAKCDYLAFMDDDDVYVSGHREIMDAAIRETPGLPIMFRMKFPDGTILPKDVSNKPMRNKSHKYLRSGNVGTPMILVPNIKEKLSTWNPTIPHADFQFINCWTWPRRNIQWKKDVIALISHNIAKPKIMKHKTISFVVATIGRDSLKDTIASIDLWKGDELLIIQHDPPSNDAGNSERQEGTEKAKCDYIAYLDDDDVYVKNHRTIMDAAIRTRPDVPVIFRMRYPNGRTPPYDVSDVPMRNRSHKYLRKGNVGTPMILVPNIKENLHTWITKSGLGDFNFINCWKWPRSKIFWNRHIIALIGHNPPNKSKST